MVAGADRTQDVGGDVSYGFATVQKFQFMMNVKSRLPKVPI
jgi:hypothetical protein